VDFERPFSVNRFFHAVVAMRRRRGSQDIVHSYSGTGICQGSTQIPICGPPVVLAGGVLEIAAGPQYEIGELNWAQSENWIADVSIFLADWTEYSQRNPRFTVNSASL